MRFRLAILEAYANLAGLGINPLIYRLVPARGYSRKTFPSGGNGAEIRQGNFM